MTYREIIEEFLACTSVSALVDVALAFATEIYETGYEAGFNDSYDFG